MAEVVGAVPVASLAEILGVGDFVEVKKSERGAKYPLYLVSKTGPIHLNTRRAQEMVSGLLAGKIPESNEKKPDEIPEKNPEKSGEKPYKGAAMAEPGKSEAGFLDWLFDGGSDELSG
jgi:hypothetical protein